MHVRAAHLPGSPLSLRFGHAGAHVKWFEQVILRHPCQLVRAGRLRASMSTRSGRSFE